MEYTNIHVKSDSMGTSCSDNIVIKILCRSVYAVFLSLLFVNLAAE